MFRRLNRNFLMKTIFQSEITKFCSERDYVYLCGDINAQTGELSDYTTDDEFLNRFFLF